MATLTDARRVTPWLRALPARLIHRLVARRVLRHVGSVSYLRYF